MRRRRRRSWPLLVPALVVTIASAATYGQTRFRVPAEPTLVVLAAVAIAAVVAREWPAPREGAGPPPPRGGPFFAAGPGVGVGGPPRGDHPHRLPLHARPR